MRQIMFRGQLKYDSADLAKKKGEWVYGYYYFRSANNPLSSSAGREFISVNLCGDWNMSSMVNVEVYNVGEFTGIMDKNRKPIYEDDIIKVHGHTHEDCFTAWVTYKNGGFWLDRDYLGNWKEYMLEVIGNIHENDPDYIDGKNQNYN